MRFGRNGSRRDPEIAPDEIFLDASASGFDRARFEGRIERPLSRASYLALSSALTLGLLILLGQAVNLELVRGNVFAAESAHNSLDEHTLFAPRGVIEDVNGNIIADNSEAPDGSITREYRLPELGQILGYVSYPKKDANGNFYDTAETGVAGLEAEYDDLLSGENGRVLTETDALGKVRSEGTVIPAVEGGTLKLSVDSSVEKALARAVADVVRTEHFNAGAGVIFDVRTGRVAAIVSYPSYDPQVMSDGSPADTIAAYNQDPGHPFLDHAVQGVYTPGSIVKPYVAAGALSDGIITPSTVIDDPGSLSIPDPYHPGKSFLYTGWRALGLMDVRSAIAWSSDVFFYTVGGGYKSQKGLGIDRLAYWYRAFGLGTTTGIDLPSEASGIVPDPAWKQKTFDEDWYTGDTYFTAIGQYGMQVTPVQMARAAAAIANGGKLYAPTLRADAAPSYATVPVSPQALQVVREGMRQGVATPGGLAGAINLPYLSVAAKTGTAQVGAHNQYDNSWVEGFFPYENPQYSFAVVLERGPTGTGEQAVNVMQEFFDTLHAEDSAYVGGTGARAASSTP
ncbi:MAG TPA: penicillin-binding transpeptidase domain-containing protein [Candidatus Paceibacterota bacterium]|nr:penicillin-binding transpeptidase domain-containing protein [Candidatus Paceibacterota bacterium]